MICFVQGELTAENVAKTILQHKGSDICFKSILNKLDETFVRDLKILFS